MAATIANTVIESAILSYVKKGDATNTPRHMLKVVGKADGTGTLKVFPGQAAKLAEFLVGLGEEQSTTLLMNFVDGIEWTEWPTYCYDTYTDKKDGTVHRVLVVRKDALDTGFGTVRMGIPAVMTLLEMILENGFGSVCVTLEYLAGLREGSPAQPQAQPAQSAPARPALESAPAAAKPAKAPSETEEQRFLRLTEEYNAKVAALAADRATLEALAAKLGYTL